MLDRPNWILWVLSIRGQGAAPILLDQAEFFGIQAGMCCLGRVDIFVLFKWKFDEEIFILQKRVWMSELFMYVYTTLLQVFGDLLEFSGASIMESSFWVVENDLNSLLNFRPWRRICSLCALKNKSKPIKRSWPCSLLPVTFIETMQSGKIHILIGFLEIDKVWKFSYLLRWSTRGVFPSIFWQDVWVYHSSPCFCVWHPYGSNGPRIFGG